jgi:hypothetical protein
MKDPLYDKIISGLSALNDGTTFEACANDLLRKLYPQLVPIPGGNDAGFDGAAAMPDGDRLQLICTTREDVIGNVSGSLTETKRKNQSGNAVLIATSQALTPQQKRNLADRVAEFGKKLYPVYDQTAFADMLYRDSAWRIRLLGIPGAPSALTAVPVGRRPMLAIPLTGREGEAKALATLTTDTVLVGQPGSGKTFLLKEVGAQSGGLFLVEDDRGRIADAIRDQQPDWIIVDDAAVNPGTVFRLRQIRDQIDAKFKIVAACWPGQQDAIAAELGTTGKDHIDLLPLPQKVILAIIHAMQIGGPEELLHELLHQSGGKPGLAVTLCQLCWQSGIKDVISGTAIVRDVRDSVTRLAGADALGILGYFAIAGDAGVSIEDVAKVTGVPALVIQKQAVALSAAGIVEVVEKRLSVAPARLRQAIVRDVFFRPGLGIPWEPMVSVVSDVCDMLETIVVAALLGGSVDHQALQPLVQACDVRRQGAKACDLYARLGYNAATWVLERFPQYIETAAQPLLEHAPQETIPALVRTFDTGVRWPSENRHTISALRKWIDNDLTPDVTMRRRIAVLDALERLAREIQKMDTLLAAVGDVMSLTFERHESVPAEPNTLRIVSGVVPLGVVPSIARLWPSVWSLLNARPAAAVGAVTGMLSDWVHPGSRVQLAEGYERVCHDLARPMIETVASDHAESWTVLRHLEHAAKRVGAKLPPPPNVLAEILFPTRELEFRDPLLAAQRESAAKLAREWVKTGPTEDLIQSWLRVEREAEENGITYPRLGRHVAYEIAKETSAHTAWLQALISAGAPRDIVEPMALRACEQSPDLNREFISEHITSKNYGRIAAECLIRFAPVASDVWQTHCSSLGKFATLVHDCVLRNQVEDATVVALLKHTDGALVRQVAKAVWSADPVGEIPRELQATWRLAVVRYLEEDYEIEEISRKHPDLAVEWLTVRLRRTWRDHIAGADMPMHNRYLGSVIATLSKEQRLSLIPCFGSETIHGDELSQIVGDDDELFRAVLARPETRPLGLSFLGMPDGKSSKWTTRAVLLLESGFTEEQVFEASAFLGGGWSGLESAYHESRRTAFASAGEHLDERVRRVATNAANWYATRRDEALKRERIAAVTGRLV